MKTYQSKLEEGQLAWLLRENKVVSMPVGSVHIKAVANEEGKPSHITVTYSFRIYGVYKDSECFATKEELLASL